MRPAVLAIDGGNSKTDLALVGADGELLASCRGPGFRPHTVGLHAALRTLDPVVAGLAPGGAEHVSAYLAGADLPVEIDRLTRAIEARNWGGTVRVDNDTFAALRAAASKPWGVAVVCGAGVNCAGVGPDGATARFPSLGRLTGDWGGGAFLADEVLWRAVRAEDGRGPDTALRPAVAEFFGTADVATVTEAVHLGDIPAARLRDLCPLLFEVARTGDAVAVALVERMAEEVVLLASVVLRRLELLRTPTEVVLAGGVLAAGHAQLLDGIDRRLRVPAPLATTVVAAVPPVLGAALLGLDFLAAGPDARELLRAAYARR